MALPIYTYEDLTWSQNVAKFCKKDLYNIGNVSMNFWALIWDQMYRDAQANANLCTTNTTICNI